MGTSGEPRRGSCPRIFRCRSPPGKDRGSCGRIPSSIAASASKGGLDGNHREGRDLRGSRTARQPCRAEGALRELHRRPLGGAGEGRLRREPHASDRRAVHRGAALDAPRTSSSRSTPPTPRKDGLGRDVDDRARARAQPDRGRDRGAPRRCSRSPRAGTTASRCARRSRPTSRSPPTTSATSPARSAPRRGGSRRSTRTRSPTTSTSRSAWSARSSRSTSRS